MVSTLQVPHFPAAPQELYGRTGPGRALPLERDPERWQRPQERPHPRGTRCRIRKAEIPAVPELLLSPRVLLELRPSLGCTWPCPFHCGPVPVFFFPI